MTIGELIDALSEYDTKLEVAAVSNFGDHFVIQGAATTPQWRCGLQDHTAIVIPNKITIELLKL